jgi:hypothetical protein
MNYLDIASLHSQLNLLYLFALVASVDQNLVQTVGWNQDFSPERITEHVLLSSRFINIGNTYNNNNNDNDNDNGNNKFYFLTILTDTTLITGTQEKTAIIVHASWKILKIYNISIRYIFRYIYNN